MNLLLQGTILHYEQFGHGPHVLVLHGWGRNLNEWLPLAHKLSGSYTVTLLDLPGFGSSEEPRTSWDTSDYANLVSNFIKKMEMDSCSIIGHSFGGRIATILAANYAKQVNSVILVDAGGIHIQTCMIKLKIFIYKIFIKPLKLLIPPSLKRSFGSSDYKALSGNMRTTFVKVVNQDLRYLFSKITRPVMVIWGSNDQVLPVEYVKIYRSLIPQSVIKVIWGADHSPHLSKPKDFSDALMEMLPL